MVAQKSDGLGRGVLEGDDDNEEEEEEDDDDDGEERGSSGDSASHWIKAPDSMADPISSVLHVSYPRNSENAAASSLATCSWASWSNPPPTNSGRPGRGIA